jgi:chromate transporter
LENEPGIDAAVVALLLAALYEPVWTSAVHSTADFGFALVAFGLSMFWKWSPWLVVVLTVRGAEALTRIGP